MKNKRFWAILLIALSYFFTYFMPIILMYIALRDSFITEYITESRYSLSFLGFMTVSGILMLALLIKLSIQLRKAKASIFKSAMFGFMHIIVVLFVVFVLIKLRNFTFVIEENTIAFFTNFRNFLNTTKNYLIIFASCLGLSMLSSIGALLIDKDFVRSIEWL